MRVWNVFIDAGPPCVFQLKLKIQFAFKFKVLMSNFCLTRGRKEEKIHDGRCAFSPLFFSFLRKQEATGFQLLVHAMVHDHLAILCFESCLARRLSMT